MPIGILKERVANKGYGFIHPDGGGLFVFCHVSGLEIEAGELRIGDLLAYEIGTGRDGRSRSVRVRWAD